MKTLLGTSALIAIGATSAGAVGLDRSNQDISVLFETGNYAELSFGYTRPNATGADSVPPFGYEYENVANNFSQVSLGYKTDLSDRLSLALIGDQPFGADVSYGGDPATTLLGGTAADLDSVALTAVLRYKVTDRFSVHGGLRNEQLDASVDLSGQAYQGLNGYSVDLGRSNATGYVVGAAYEIPDIALRVALTYNSSMTHEFDSTETLNGLPLSALPPTATGGLDGIGTTEVKTPESWNLDFQTGIAPDTLLLASIRHAQYSQTEVSPEFFALATGGGSITDLEDGTAYSIGIGRRFSDNFAGSVTFGYEPEGDDDLVSPLSPTNGNKSIQIGGSYTMDAITISGGVRYTMLGDAKPEVGTPDFAVADFEDNSAVSLGLSVGYRF